MDAHGSLQAKRYRKAFQKRLSILLVFWNYASNIA
ncbi:hypothetical protein DO70_4579 [Burkholderia pseudomallei]|nr:hypothetical protein DO70_4579 [Burkholderia pseudomallei]